MAKVIETQVRETKIVLELGLEEAQGLHELLYCGVVGGTLRELKLWNLMNGMHDHMNLHGSVRMFTRSAQL